MYYINHLVFRCQLEMPSISPVFIFHVMRHSWSLCFYMQNSSIHPACLVQEANALFHLWDSFKVKMEQSLILFIFVTLADSLNLEPPKESLVCFLLSNSSYAVRPAAEGPSWHCMLSISHITGFLWTRAFILFLFFFMFCNIVIYKINSVLAWLHAQGCQRNIRTGRFLSKAFHTTEDADSSCGSLCNVHN